MIKDNHIPILLVDDDEVDVMSVKRVFRKFKVANPLHVAKNGVEALAMLRGNGKPRISPRPGLILLDLNMPKMNGLEFLKALRADPYLSSIPVIVLTTSNDDGDKIRAFNYHVAGYFVKPVVGAQFVDIMASLNQYWAISQLPPPV